MISILSQEEKGWTDAELQLGKLLLAGKTKSNVKHLSADTLYTSLTSRMLRHITYAQFLSYRLSSKIIGHLPIRAIAQCLRFYGIT